jgi:transposase InsO family protein
MSWDHLLGSSFSIMSKRRRALSQNALDQYPAPAILHSDQGSEYLSLLHQEICERYEIQLSASDKGSPWQNGDMERWFGNFMSLVR